MPSPITQKENPICSPVSSTSVSTSFPFQIPQTPLLPLLPPLAVYCVAFINSIPKTKLRATSPLTLTQFGSLLLLALRICCFFLFCYFLSLCLCFAVSLSLSRCLTNTVDLPPAVAHWHWPGSPMWATMAIDGAIDDDLALSQDWECEDIMPAHNTILCNVDGLWHWAHSHIIYGSRRVHLSQFCDQSERSF